MSERKSLSGLKCNNPLCITNNDVEAKSSFRVISEKPMKLRCNYCNTTLSEEDIKKEKKKR